MIMYSEESLAARFDLQLLSVSLFEDMFLQNQSNTISHSCTGAAEFETRCGGARTQPLVRQSRD